MNRTRLVVLLIIIVLIMGIYYFKIDKKEKDNVFAPDNVTGDNGDYENGEGLEVPDYEIAIGEKAPEFTLEDLEGNLISLSDYRGKMVLLNFWTTWCKYCDIEMPDLQELEKQNEDLVVLAINTKEEKPVVERYIEKGGYKFKVLLDKFEDVSKTYLVSAFPTSYFIDSDGILLGGVQGMMEYENMELIIKELRE